MGTREFAGRDPAAGGGGWRSTAWKVAAAVALVATGFGVWQVNRVASGPETGWDPGAAMAAWEEDLEDLRPGLVDLRVALGVEADGGGVAWEEVGLSDVDAVTGPGEEER